jgi:hypothetical protein
VRVRTDGPRRKPALRALDRREYYGPIAHAREQTHTCKHTRRSLLTMAPSCGYHSLRTIGMEPLFVCVKPRRGERRGLRALRGSEGPLKRTIASLFTIWVDGIRVGFSYSRRPPSSSRRRRRRLAPPPTAAHTHTRTHARTHVRGRRRPLLPPFPRQPSTRRPHAHALTYSLPTALLTFLRSAGL